VGFYVQDKQSTPIPAWILLLLYTFLKFNLQAVWYSLEVFLSMLMRLNIFLSFLSSVSSLCQMFLLHLNYELTITITNSLQITCKYLNIL